ncbi:MAG: hypothetical protein MJZ20_12345 [Bacteroidaceae bacterium]|nr:hypothetical protein [Bacteroidaceae bacterium]
MPNPYPNGTKVHLLSSEIVDDFMGLDAYVWDAQRRYNNNVHVIAGCHQTNSENIRGYYFESTYCDVPYYWNAKYVIPISEDLSQYDFE